MTAHLIYTPHTPELESVARELAPKGLELTIARIDSPEFAAAIGTTDYLIGFPNRVMNDDFYRKAPKLRLIQLISAGYDDLDLEAARRAKVLICNNGGANSIAVSEHAMMLMLAVSRRLTTQHNNVASGRWRGNGPQPRMYELFGKTLGVIGLGTIGKKVARLARAFNMQVQYYDITRLTEAEEDALGVRFRLRDEVLRSSDIITLHVPLNASTKHMIGAAELALMKTEAILINTSRGPVIDETALHDALERKALFGAGLDVFDREPPSPDNPLLKLDNVVLTAHYAGPNWDNQMSRLRNSFDNVQRMHRGQKPLWIVPELAD